MSDPFADEDGGDEHPDRTRPLDAGSRDLPEGTGPSPIRPLPGYAELHCLTNFSFLKGASHPEELVLRASELGYAGLAITDECSLAGVVRAHTEAKNTPLKLLIGSSFVLEDGLQLVLIAIDIHGYGNLSELITLGRMRCEKGTYRLTRADFDGTPQSPDQIPEAAGTIDHLAGLPNCIALWIPSRDARDAALEADARWFASTFPDRARPVGDHDPLFVPQRAWIAVQRTHRMDDELVIRRLVALGSRMKLPCVATGNVHMHVRSRKPLQDSLTAIRLGRSVAECGDDLAPNAERHLRTRMRLSGLFLEPLLEETVIIANQCRFSLKELGYRYPKEIVPEGETQTSYLRRLTEEGLVTRFPKVMIDGLKPGAMDKVHRQIEHELALIADLRYEAFFLTVHDIVRYARSVGILCQGRGSAANSAVCFCLGITEVNPALQDMLFERFLTKERNEPPDIDVDFEHQRREEVIQYIYDKYGRHRTALAATVIAYRTRSAIRDVGKALGLDAERINRLSGSHAWWDGSAQHRERLEENGFDPDSPVVRKLIELTATLRSFPRHLSQHVGGFVISADKLSRMVPIENAAMQAPSDWDEDLGRRTVFEDVAFESMHAIGRGEDSFEEGTDQGEGHIEGGDGEADGDGVDGGDAYRESASVNPMERCAEDAFDRADSMDRASGGVDGGLNARRDVDDGFDARHRVDGDLDARRGVDDGDCDSTTTSGSIRDDIGDSGNVGSEGNPDKSTPERRTRHKNIVRARSDVAYGHLGKVDSGEGSGGGNDQSSGLGSGSGSGSGFGNGNGNGSLSDAPIARNHDRGRRDRTSAVFPTFRSVIQWDKDDLEELGLLKVDVLALGMLSAIRRALDLVGKRRGRPMRMIDIPPEDPKTYEMIRRADTVGVFQIESRAQMSMLPRLRPTCYYDLVVEVAIVRPGPIQGGMVHPYLKAREAVRNNQPIDYPQPGAREALERTLGVPIFQEQVMQLMMLAAHFSAGEADKLRRAMAAWKRKGGLGPFHDRIVEGMIANGYKKDYAERIFKQIEGFGEYGFPESHAASFAFLVYVSSWIKCHEPAAFLAALLNSQPLGFYSSSQLIQDAKRNGGVEVRPIDVTISEWDADLEEQQERKEGDAKKEDQKDQKDQEKQESRVARKATVEHDAEKTASRLQPAVRLGFNSIKSFNRKAATRLVTARRQQPFKNVDDLGRRARLSTLELDALAAADALTPLAGHRRQARWQAASHRLDSDLTQTMPIAEASLELPFATEGREIVDDYASTGFTLRRHPLALLRPRLRKMNLLSAAELDNVQDGQWVRTTGIVTVRQRPGTAKGTIFVSLEDETGVINVIVWKHVIEAQRRPLLSASLLTVFGKWQRQGIVRHVIADELHDNSALIGKLYTTSRDFH